MIALLNQKRGKPLGFVNPLLYPLAKAKPSAFHDIIKGSNGVYSARAGWDACTGLGSPNGAGLVAALAASGPPPVSVPPPVTGTRTDAPPA